MGVTIATSISSFFHQVLTEALLSEGVQVSALTECYLVELLGEYAHSQIPSGSLALRLAQSEAGERVTALKEVGDTSLVVTGFFADSLERGTVSPDYYVSLGQGAYRELSSRLSSSSVAEVYDELAAKFPRFVDVLAAVRSQVSFVGSDVVELYAEWQRTKSEWIERRLRAMGMIAFTDEHNGVLQ